MKLLPRIRSILRLLRASATALSILLLLTTLAGFFCSFHIAHVTGPFARGSPAITPRLMFFPRSSFGPPIPPPRDVLLMRSVVVGPLGQWTIEASAYTTTGWPSPPGGWSIGKGSSLPGTPMMMGHQHFLGFSHQAGGAAVSFGSFIMERADQRWTAPAWFMLTLFSILPALSLLARLRRNHARHQNRCPTCGYDLRAHTPGQRCPECGSQITSVPHTAASPALAGAPHASDHS